MSDKPPDTASQAESDLAKVVEAKAIRKLRTQRAGVPGIWSGFGIFGLIGWSIVLPTLLGAFLGAWWDRHHHGAHSWTLMLLVIGLIFGCANAWHWMVSEDQAARKKEDEDE